MADTAQVVRIRIPKNDRPYINEYSRLLAHINYLHDIANAGRIDKSVAAPCDFLRGCALKINSDIIQVWKQSAD